MASMIEKKAESIRKEIEKLEKRLARQQEQLVKKVARAEKVNANWTTEEFFQHRDTDMTDDQWAAYFDKYSIESDIEDTEEQLKNAHKRLSKVLPKIDEAEAERAESQRVDSMESKFYSISRKSKEEQEAEYEAWLKWFKAECLKDGIVIEHVDGWMMAGTTKSGKSFGMWGNSGYTERSLHCYTLYIDKKMVFTSGDFSTAYQLLKK